MNALKVLVYGATGSQARPLVHKLLDKGHTPYVLTRHADKAADLQAAGGQIVIGTLEDAASLRAVSENMDVVALLIPAFLEKPWEGVQYAYSAIDAAKAAGVKRILWNTSGPVPTNRNGQPMNDSRIDILEYLQASGVAHIIFEPTLYIENLLGPWTAQSIVQHNQVSYPIRTEKKVGWLPSDDLASLMTAAVERTDLDGSHFKVSGIEAVTGAELAQIFSRVLQRDLTYYQMSPEEMGAVIDKMFGAGAGDIVADEYRKQQNDPNPLPNYHDMSVVLDKLPVEMTPISEWIIKHLAAFTPVAETQQ